MVYWLRGTHDIEVFFGTHKLQGAVSPGQPENYRYASQQAAVEEDLPEPNTTTGPRRMHCLLTPAARKRTSDGFVRVVPGRHAQVDELDAQWPPGSGRHGRLRR